MTKFGFFCPMDYYPVDGRQVNPETYSRTLQQIRLADELHFDSFWIAEGHFAYVNGICPSPAVFLAHAFAQTRRINLGPAVCVLPLHHPLRVAEDYALLDSLSDGRLLMGVGSGFLEDSFRGFQIPIEEKQERFFEALEILKRAWSGERFSHTGKYHRIEEVQLNVLPRKGSAQELWISVTRPESMTALACEGYSLIMSPFLSNMTDQAFFGVLRNIEHAFVEGNTSKSLDNVAVVVHVYVGKDMETAERVALSAYENRMRYLVETHDFSGDLRVAMRTLKIARSRGLVLFGDAEYVRERINIFREQGVRNILLFMDFGGMPQDHVLESMWLFAEQVMPHFR